MPWKYKRHSAILLENLTSIRQHCQFICTTGVTNACFHAIYTLKQVTIPTENDSGNDTNNYSNRDDPCN